MNEFKGETFGDLALAFLELTFQYKDCNAKSEAKNAYFKETP